MLISQVYTAVITKDSATFAVFSVGETVKVYMYVFLEH